MAEASKDESENLIERVFLANDILPNAADAFADRIAPIEDAIKTADVVLDTNVLLLPYGAGANSFRQIIEAFKVLRKENRLYLPAQVAREFVKNRPTKLGELQQGLSDKISRFSGIDKLSFSILEDVSEYQDLNSSIQKVAELKSQLVKTGSALIKRIRSWEWNDPVNTAYREVFTAEAIIEPTIEREKVITELRRRQALSIPPGYKDAAKEDLGVGDFLIWKTIIAIGSKNSKHIIFVSGDEKADWQHRTGGAGFLPRFELVDEYRRSSSGKSFYIIPLSKLLELLKAGTSVIEEIKKEETRIQVASTVCVSCPNCGGDVHSHLGESVGSSAGPWCPVCGVRFHVHRVSGGVTVHRAYERVEREGVVEEDVRERLEKGESFIEKISCPACKTEFEGVLGAAPKSTAWFDCPGCKFHFPIHRRRDGGVLISTPRGAGFGLPPISDPNSSPPI